MVPIQKFSTDVSDVIGTVATKAYYQELIPKMGRKCKFSADVSEVIGTLDTKTCLPKALLRMKKNQESIFEGRRQCIAHQ